MGQKCHLTSMMGDLEMDEILNTKSYADGTTLAAKFSSSIATSSVVNLAEIH